MQMGLAGKGWAFSGVPSSLLYWASGANPEVSLADKSQPGHQKPSGARVLDLGYLCLVITSGEQTSFPTPPQGGPGGKSLGRWAPRWTEGPEPWASTRQQLLSP